MVGFRELALTFDWEGLRLNGSLHLPTGSASFPAVVMAQGSGPADRDSGGYFVPIRRALLDRGIATFAFDKPGCGESAGDWRNYGLEARASQTQAAVELVRRHPTISLERVGLWGHSQGGWLVQKIAGCDPDLAFAVASSAPSISLQEQIVYDAEQTLRAQGREPLEVEAALELTRALLTAAGERAHFEWISDHLLEPASKLSWFQGYPGIDDAADWDHFVALVDDPHDPLSDLHNVRCPILVLFGGLDVLLPPWRGAQESGLALASAPTMDATVTVFPNGNHRLQEVDSGAFVTGYLELLADWISHRVGQSSTERPGC